ncbi:MAG: sensor histidine kinase [Gemmatimonadetes bacterium]|nr:sensor histidine kinase [Gemmatimonadota bacterium]
MLDLGTHPGTLAALADPSHHRHAVQFYEDDAFLMDALAEFVARGLDAGRPVLVIATEAHREALAGDLAARGVEVARTRVSGQLTLLDAREVLDRFMVGGLPDEARFRGVVGEALDRALRVREGATVSAFGEMVDLLWKDGNPEGAIRLEALWNELAASYSFSLLCGYAIGNFGRAGDTEAFARICGQHDHVVPTERYTRLDEDERLRGITALEQRAQALEGELAYQRELERRRPRRRRPTRPRASSWP